MTVYLIAFIAAIIAAFLNDRMSPGMRRSILSVLCLYVILVFGFRYKVGIDTISYMDAYSKIPSLENIYSTRDVVLTRYEPGYLFVCSLCKSFTNDFWPVQMILAAITNGCIFIFLYRYCRNAFVGVLFYFLIFCFYFSAEVIRESAAVGIFLLNFKNLQEKKWLPYYLFSFLSICFHYSAVIIWFFPLAKWLNSNAFFYIVCIAMLAITPLVEKFNAVLQIAAISGRIDQYVAGAEDLNLNWRIGQLIRTCFPAIATLICFHLYKLKVLFRPMLLMQIILCMGAFAIPIIFSRFTNYTAMFVIVAISNLLSSQALKFWIKIVFVSFVLLTQSYSFYTSYNRWIPYVSIFYPEDLPYRNDIYRHTFFPWLKNARLYRN